MLRHGLPHHRQPLALRGAARFWGGAEPTSVTAAGVGGVGIIPPVEDVYDREDPHFTDPPSGRLAAAGPHRYLLDLKDPEVTFYPYFFVWNDFAWEAGAGICRH